MAQEIPGYCVLCRSRCGTLNTVEGDRLVAVSPDRGHPTGAAMCPKGRAAPELVHSADRLLYPMRRTRPKGGDPGWERISWDAALATVASRLAAIRAESGPEAVAFFLTTPSGTPISDSIDWVERFIRAFGSPNTCYGTEVCNWHKDVAHAFTFGCGMPTADYAQADLIVLWGHNPTKTWLAQADAVARGRARGARLIVVDPQRTALAAQADAWLQVRPGTDAAVALGLIRLLMEREGHDDDFIRRWSDAPLLVREDTGRFLRARDCAGLEGEGFVVWHAGRQAPGAYDTRRPAERAQAAAWALAGEFEIGLAGGGRVRCRPAWARLRRHCDGYTPERVAALSGVAPQQLRAAADLYAASPRVAYHTWTGVGQSVDATQTERAIATLYALTGAFDRPGGNRLYARAPLRDISGKDLIDDAKRSRALGLDRRPLGPPRDGWVTAHDVYDAILEHRPYPVRAAFGFGANPLLSHPETRRGDAAFRALEFHVHCDLFETPTARYADILLPVNTPWEHEGLRAGFEISLAAQEHIQLRPRMVPPRGESRADYEIVLALAERIGMEAAFFGASLDAGWDHMLAPLGITVGELRARPGGVRFPLVQRDRKYAETAPDGSVTGFATPTRRVTLYSEMLLDAGYAPLPEPDIRPPPPGRPLLLTCAKSGYFCHSQHRSVTTLRRRAMHPEIGLSPAAAQARGVAPGDWVRVRSAQGEIRLMARIDPDLQDDVAVGDYGWWQACTGLGQPGFDPLGPAGSNFNVLVDGDEADPVSGSVPLRSVWCEVERLPATDGTGRPWQGERPFMLRRRDTLLPGVAALWLEPADGGPLPDYEPGQHIVLSATLPDGACVRRAYSLTGPARLPGRRGYAVAVRRILPDPGGGTAAGRMSGYLHEGLAVGDVIQAGAPSGRFIVPAVSAQPVVLFAAGIGITPFVGYLETLALRPDMPEVWLHYAVADIGAFPFRDRLLVLAQRLPRLHVHLYGRGVPPAAAGFSFHAGRVDAAVVHGDLPRRHARFYLCASPAMMDGLIAGLVARGVPRFDVFSEAFQAPLAEMPAPGQSFTVRFARSRLPAATWTSADGTLLEFGERLGLALPSGCRVGQCESCALAIISGRVRHLNGTGSDDPGQCLTCQAIPASDLMLDA